MARKEHRRNGDFLRLSVADEGAVWERTIFPALGLHPKREPVRALESACIVFILLALSRGEC
jgi:hypothetical protein